MAHSAMKTGMPDELAMAVATQQTELARRLNDGGQADAMLAQASLFRASELAREGRYAEAEAVLAGLSGSVAASLQGLDLLARIRAQQGRLAEAQQLWTQALDADPRNEAYRAALERIARIHQNTWQRRTIWIAAVILVFLLAGAAAMAVVSSYAQRERQSLLTEMRSIVDARAPAPTEQVQAPAITVNQPGVIQTADGGEVVLQFEEGLFAQGAELTPQGKALLTAVGRQLEPFADGLRLQIVGYTDNVPVRPESPFADNAFLAVARADAVARHLDATTRLPASVFALQANPSGEYPFNNDDSASRLKNRTVEIRAIASR